MRSLLRDCAPGGILLFAYNLQGSKDQVRAFLSDCSALARVAGIPPFIAVDHEGGMIHRFGPGVGRLPAPGVFWEQARQVGQAAALEYLEEEVRRSAWEIRDLGITMNLAPVVEVADEKNRRFLGSRIYGPDPAFVEAAAGTFIQAMEAAGIACVIKHFPGNTGADPHKEKPLLKADRETLNRMIRPFVTLMAASRHQPALMVSHVVVEAWDRERNASLSPVVLREWLRWDLGFRGLLIADDLAMNAVSGSMGIEAAAVLAIQGGVDMIIVWPPDLRGVHRAIMTALEKGRLSRERLQEAVAQVLFEKLWYGLIPDPGA
jgi:beta-N-acetylhexosaminidase